MRNNMPKLLKENVNIYSRELMKDIAELQGDVDNNNVYDLKYL